MAKAAFISKLNDVEAEAAETQVWLQFAVDCEYVDRDFAASLYVEYDNILAQSVDMIHNAHRWIIPKKKRTKEE